MSFYTTDECDDFHESKQSLNDTSSWKWPFEHNDTASKFNSITIQTGMIDVWQHDMHVLLKENVFVEFKFMSNETIQSNQVNHEVH